MRLFFASESKGRQGEVARLATQFASQLEMAFPTPETRIDVGESGSSSHENALLKALPYRQTLGDHIIVAAEDNGIKIPALGGEPGVNIRRWAGHVMNDQEIIDHCLTRMKGLEGDERRAIVESVVVMLRSGEEPKYFRGEIHGHILEEPIFSVPLDGFPFRTLFWVEGLETSMYHMHNMSPRERGGFLTHREQAFVGLFNDLATTAAHVS